jgi:hypothetical protein
VSIFRILPSRYLSLLPVSLGALARKDVGLRLLEKKKRVSNTTHKGVGKSVSLRKSLTIALERLGFESLPAICSC